MQSVDYHPIPPGSRRFRILTLEPSETFTADIACTLSEASLDSPSEYEALSYVWGEPAKTHSVTLAGNTVGVTQNLAIALRHLRLPHRPRDLWVDALCIDQYNIDERDDQVMHMKEIYQRCSADLLWLGEDASIIERGAAVMESIGSITKLEGNFELERYLGEHGGDFVACLEPGKEAPRELPPGGWTKALAALFRKPQVWQRVWIMQEVCSAPRVVLVGGGGATLPWERVDAFLDVERYIQKHGFPDAFHEPFSHGYNLKNELIYCLAHAQILAHQRRIAATLQKQQRGDAVAPTSSLLDILARFRYTKATDDRDMVFALLGLASDPLSITPTYHASVREVYTSTAAAIINTSRNLDLLCQSPWQLAGNFQRDSSLLSWVPDFAHPGRAHILFAQRGIYSASGNEELKTPCSVTEDGGIVLEGWDSGALHTLRRRDSYPETRAFEWMPNELLREGIAAGNKSLSIFLKKGEDEPGLKCREKRDVRCEVGARCSRFDEYWRTLLVDCKRYPITRLDEQDVEEMRPDWEAWLRLPWVTETEELSEGIWPSLAQDGNARIRHKHLMYTSQIWPLSFAILEDGSYAMVPIGAEKGDHVAVLKGAKTPVLLRMVEGEECWRLIGACYVYGLMDGEVVDKEGCERRKFVVV